jgi:hypothetical protein
MNSMRCQTSIRKQQRDVALKEHVARLYLKCFRCFIGMLQVLHIDVAYVAMVVRVCCKLMFPRFYLFFSYVCCKCVYLDVAYISHICCKCFIWMLRISVFQVFFKRFRCMFQRFICLETYVTSVVSEYFKNK